MVSDDQLEGFMFQSPRNRVNISNEAVGEAVQQRVPFGFNPLEIGSTFQIGYRWASSEYGACMFQSPRNRVNISNAEGRQGRPWPRLAVSIP